MSADETTDPEAETRWIVQFAEPFGENHPQRVVETEAEADAVIEELQAHFPEVEDEPGQYRIDLGAEVYITKMEIPYGPLPDDWTERYDLDRVEPDVAADAGEESDGA